MDWNIIIIVISLVASGKTVALVSAFIFPKTPRGLEAGYWRDRLSWILIPAFIHTWTFQGQTGINSIDGFVLNSLFTYCVHLQTGKSSHKLRFCKKMVLLCCGPWVGGKGSHKSILSYWWKHRSTHALPQLFESANWDYCDSSFLPAARNND